MMPDRLGQAGTADTAPSESPRVREVVVVGAGFAGIGAAIRLRQQGVDVLVLEKSDAIGGVWRDNTYPDCGCDVPSALYSYSFAPNPGWSRMFAKQEEIRAYSEDTARKFGVLAHVRFGQELVSATWQAADKVWLLQTPSASYRARFVVMACGPMHVPVTPRIRGLETFTGVQFHSARWNHRCDFRDKRVAVIGSGASAIQFLPQIQPLVRQLTLFQRTAPWVLPKFDWEIPEGLRTLFGKFPPAQALLRKLLYLQFEMLNSSLKYPRLIRRIEKLGLKNIARGIADPGLRARVTPNFSLGCKRILLSNNWYRALARPNVQVVGGIAEIQGNRVIASDGSASEVDVIVFATGFEVADPPIAKVIVGASGVRLSERWNGSPEAYLGTMAQDCPNLFLTLGPNLYTFSSAFVMIEAQLQFIVSAITTARRKGIATIAVDPARSRRYNAQVQESMQKTVWNSGCSSYFIDRNGRNSTNWPWTTFYMRSRLRRFQPSDYLIGHGNATMNHH